MTTASLTIVLQCQSALVGSSVHDLDPSTDDVFSLLASD